MLNRSASLAMSRSVLKALPGKLDIKRHSPSILYKLILTNLINLTLTKLNPDTFCIANSVYTDQLASGMASGKPAGQDTHFFHSGLKKIFITRILQN